jgi:two-component system cell cycle response regulator
VGGGISGSDEDDLRNDASGHDAGDMAILAIAARLRERLRASDHIARTGGDEFVVVMPNTSVSRRPQ